MGLRSPQPEREEMNTLTREQVTGELDITQISDNLTADRVGLHRMFDAMKAKMYAKHLEGRGGWHNDCTIEHLEQLLTEHIDKAWADRNLVDIANFCMMLWNRHNPRQAAAALSSPPSEQAQPVALALERAARVVERRAENRVHSTASYDPSTNAWEYPKHAEDVGNALDEEADDCAREIRALIGSLASPQAETLKDAEILVQDMAMLIRRLCRKIEIHTEGDLNGILKSASSQARDFLKRKGLQGSPLRDDASPPPQPAQEVGEFPWIIYYDDPSVPPEIFGGAGAEKSARARFAEAQNNWNCTLFVDASALSSQQPVASAAVRECGEQIAWVADEHGSKVLFWKHDGDIPWVAEHYPNAVPLYTARLTQAGK